MDKVIVLISTYNGERFLREQINSLLAQEDVIVDILVRDDGSTDNTVNILNEYQEKGILKWYTGENKKPALSFLDLVQKSPKARYYAFCDQDDIWKPEKLKRALMYIKKEEENEEPILYCANYQLVNENLKELPDNKHVSTTRLNEAVVSSCATGCTIVFNTTLMIALKKYIPRNIVMHDDWAHKVCLAIGGKVFYDKTKVIYYRQHGNNADGGVHSLRKRIFNILRRVKNKDCIRSLQLQEIIHGYEKEIDIKNLELIRKVAYYNKSFISRIKVVFSKEINTPYNKLNIGFKIAILLGYF